MGRADAHGARRRAETVSQTARRYLRLDLFRRTIARSVHGSASVFDKWLTVAEKRAKLPKLHGGLWHPYRRKWATERKHHAITDVAAAGGWKDVETLLTCYQQPDAETMLAVMSDRKKCATPHCSTRRSEARFGETATETATPSLQHKAPSA